MDEKKLDPTMPQAFTFTFWMKHEPDEDKNRKDNILCSSDDHRERYPNLYYTQFFMAMITFVITCLSLDTVADVPKAYYKRGFINILTKHSIIKSSEVNDVRVTIQCFIDGA